MEVLGNIIFKVNGGIEMEKTKYRQLFKEILKAYYEEIFEEKIEEIMNREDIDKESLSKVISALCGVEVNYSDNFSEDLKFAIKNYQETNKVVINTSPCTKNCVKVDGKIICENACPFDAIIVDKETLLPNISIDLCVNCGICVDSCKNKNFIDKIEFLPILEILKENKKVIAAVAPSIAGQFGENVSMGQLRAALKYIGFEDMVEVAFFADILTIKEAVEFNRYINKEKDFLLSSCCCPIWVGMIKGRFKELVKYTSPSVSPMIAAGKIIKEIDPECKVVFIGPCVAKKGEAKSDDIKDAIDHVLTFTELKDIFEVFDIEPNKFHEELSTQYSSRGGRIYGRIGGVSSAVEDAVKEMYPDKIELFTSEQASGIKECKAMLQSALKGETSAAFLEGMGCDGGCVGGPKTIISKEKGKEHIEKYGDDSKVNISVNNKIMKKFLRNIGIDNSEDFEDKRKVKIFERKL